MSTDLGITKSFKHEFMLDEQLLRKILSVVDEHRAKLPFETTLQFRITKKDSTFFNAYTISEVLADDNSKGKTISRLIIQLYKKNNEKENKDTELFSIDFEKEHQYGVFYSINHDDREWCFLFLDELEGQIKRLERSQVWKHVAQYWFQTPFYILVSCIVAALCFYIFSDTQLAAVIGLSSSEIAQNTGLIGLTRLLMTMFCFIFLLVVLEAQSPLYTLSQTFRESVFYWGDEINRYDRVSSLKKNLFWVVLVGFMVSVLAGLALISVQS